MEHRERFYRAIAGEQTDRCPYDLGGTSLTNTFDKGYYERLAKGMGLSYNSQDEAKEVVQRALDIDFRHIGYLMEPGRENYRRSGGEYTDCFGITRRWTGQYDDIVGYPLKDATMEELETYRFPDAAELEQKIFDDLREEAKRLHEGSDYAVVASHPVLGVFELGCWMCSFDDFLYRLLAEPEFVERFFEKFYVYQRDVIERYYGAIGDYIDVTTSGDDFGTQSGPFMSCETFEEMIAPWYEKRIQLTKQYTSAKYFHHTCGSVYRLMGAIKKMGVELLNPIQPGAFEMEPERIKESFGEQLVFWGGIDEQGYLTSGTPEEIRQGVKQALGILSKGGKYVMAMSHNIQNDVDPRNILTAFQAANEFFGLESRFCWVE